MRPGFLTSQLVHSIIQSSHVIPHFQKKCLTVNIQGAAIKSRPLKVLCLSLSLSLDTSQAKSERREKWLRKSSESSSLSSSHPLHSPFSLGLLQKYDLLPFLKNQYCVTFSSNQKSTFQNCRSDRDCPGFRRTTCEGRGPNFLFIFPTCARFFLADKKLGPRNYGCFQGEAIHCAWQV